MSLFTVSFRELSDELMICGKNLDQITDLIKRKKSTLTTEQIQFVKEAIKKRFLGHFNKRWEKANRNKNVFLRYNNEWLLCKYIYTNVVK